MLVERLRAAIEHPRREIVKAWQITRRRFSGRQRIRDVSTPKDYPEIYDGRIQSLGRMPRKSSAADKISRRRSFAAAFAAAALASSLAASEALAQSQISNGESGLNTRTALNVALGQFINVKDPLYGATGNGVTDDRAAIQSAVDALGVNSGTIYFPPGIYIIGSPGISLDTNGDNKSLIMLGCGNASELRGNFAGFIIDKASTSGGGTYYVRKISQLYVNNSNASGGCIRLEGSWPAEVRDCLLSGNIGFSCSTNSAVDIANCKVGGLGGSGYGIAVSGECTVYKCDVTGFGADGIRATGAAGSIIGCRCEINTGSAIYLGKLANGSLDAAQGWFVAGNSLEGNGEGIHGRSIVACTITANLIHGEDGNGSISGIHIEANSSYCTVSDLSCYGDFGVTSVSVGTITGWVSPANTALLTITGAPTFGALAVGQLVYIGGTFYGSIGSLGTGAGGTGTYNLINNTVGNHASATIGTTGVTSAFSSVQIEAPQTALVFRNVDSHIATSGHGVAWNVTDGCGAQFYGCTYVPSSQLIANAPLQFVGGVRNGALDGDYWVFTNGNTTTFGADVVAAGTGTTRVRAQFSYTDNKWYCVGKG